MAHLLARRANRPGYVLGNRLNFCESWQSRIDAAMRGILAIEVGSALIKAS